MWLGHPGRGEGERGVFSSGNSESRNSLRRLGRPAVLESKRGWRGGGQAKRGIAWMEPSQLRDTTEGAVFRNGTWGHRTRFPE